MKFKRMKRSRLEIKWMKKYPILARLYAFTALFWGPIVLTIGILWEERRQYTGFFEDAVSVICLEDDIDG